MKNKVKKIFLMILLCNIVVLIVPFYTHAAQKGWVKVGKTYRYRVQSSYVKNRVKKIKGKWYYFDGQGNKEELPTKHTIESGIITTNLETSQLKRQTLDGYHLQNCNKLMIVAHPDDESLWGGGHLLDKGYFVVCLTNGNNTVRRSEFYAALKEYGCQGIMFSYPDLERGKRSDWSNYSDIIAKDLNVLLTYKRWDMIATHNPKGEYGHIQHRMTSKLVTEVYRCNYKGLNRLYYFGKYYKWNQLSQVENGLISLSKDKLNRKIQIINTVYKSQDVKWDRHMMKYENWIAFQDWKEKN